MRYGVLDSGLGLLGCAAALLDRDPQAELVLALDPDGMPYGARAADDVVARLRALGRVLADYRPDAIVVACNTASVHGLDALRADLEPATPVIGTVPAIKPAAATGRPIAVWATVRTTGSRYQRDLIANFAAGRSVTEVACPGFAEAVEAADPAAIAAAVTAAVAATPPAVTDIVLGCTHFPLAVEDITAAFDRPVLLYDSAGAVADQTVRRAAAAAPADRRAARPRPTGQSLLAVVESGRHGRLPARALRYPAGRRVASVATRDTEPLASPAV
jgi:glutamate racemase